MAFIKDDKIKLKSVQRELNLLLNGARKKYRDTIEHNFNSGDTKKLWDAMKIETNMVLSCKRLITSNNGKLFKYFFPSV